jgi:hypothetical protein
MPSSLFRLIRLISMWMFPAWVWHWSWQRFTWQWSCLCSSYHADEQCWTWWSQLIKNGLCPFFSIILLVVRHACLPISSPECRPDKVRGAGYQVGASRQRRCSQDELAVIAEIRSGHGELAVLAVLGAEHSCTDIDSCEPAVVRATPTQQSMCASTWCS